MKLNKTKLKEMLARVPKRVEPKIGFTQAAVLLLFFNRENQTHLVFIERTKGDTPHGGQIAFPGGKIEPNDVSPQAAAFRETQEEIGVSRHLYDYVGNIGFYLTTVSRFDACAHIAWAETRPAFAPDAYEVARIFEIPVASLYHQFIPNLDVSDTSPLLNLEFNVLAENVSLNIWGLTARMTHHFLIGLHHSLKP